jgi:putative inorganic carbon (HCO3(-)) transporter
LTNSLENKWLYGVIATFFVVFSIGIVYEQYWVLAIPVAVAIAGLAFFSLDKLMWFILFATPLSITLTDKQFNLGLSLPTEPLLFGVLCIVVFKWLSVKKSDPLFWKHPIVLAILFYLFWILVTSLTSEFPIISLKYFLVKLWFIVPFFYVMVYMFRDDVKNYNRYLWVFLVPLSIAAIYTLTVHAQHDFSKSSSTWVMFPLFKEHTSWGAVLAIFYPVSIYLVVRKGDLGIRAIASVILIIMTLALVLSYTRAAWVSLIGAGIVYVLLYFKVKFSRILVLGLAGLIMLFAAREEIAKKFEGNKQDSSEQLGEHVQSISNVSTDASNLERINRWKSAYRMFEERPIVGWGPGTYMFVYAPFQKPHEKTIISTNAGNRGNAHSEYLGPLAESGVLGMVSVILLVTVLMVYGIKLYHSLDKGTLKDYTLLAILGLITYFTHGFLNNFLDMDKASAPVWGFSAVLVSIDLYYKKNSKVSKG